MTNAEHVLIGEFNQLPQVTELHRAQACSSRACEHTFGPFAFVLYAACPELTLHSSGPTLV